MLHAEGDKGRALVLHECFGEFEDQRVSRIERYVHLATQNEILLCIVLSDAIKRRCAAKRVARIDREPDDVAKRIADVRFESGKSLLS
jgi:hypothetical protein